MKIRRRDHYINNDNNNISNIEHKITNHNIKNDKKVMKIMTI